MKKDRLYHIMKITRSGRISTLWVWVLVAIVVILSGVGYRVLASRLKLVVETPVNLPVSLSAFPAEIGNWAGKDVPISTNIQRVAGNDDFINRLYINRSNNEWANVYVAYCARPRNMMGHRPDICYVGGGWVHDGTETSEFISISGRHIPCLIHRFHKPAPETEEVVVLNFYISNGQISNDESAFTGLGWRTPNISGNPARYVTQVQISSILENPTRSAAKEMTDLLLEFFPDENGKVRAAQFIQEFPGDVKRESTANEQETLGYLIRQHII